MIWDKNDEPQNVNPIVPQFGNNVFQQDLGTFQNRYQQDHRHRRRRSRFQQHRLQRLQQHRPAASPAIGTTNFEFGFKQPLLQGAGSLYNRIAGPFDPLRGIGTYLQYDGVIIARIRTDIRLADFEAGVRNFVSDVENAYWELYFAYRNLEAAKSGRDAALQTWQEVHAMFVSEAPKVVKPTRKPRPANNTSSSAARWKPRCRDLYRAENRLRYMMGLAATDGRLIRPCDEPTDANVLFDWCEVHAEGLCRSVELRQQKWRIKQRKWN